MGVFYPPAESPRHVTRAACDSSHNLHFLTDLCAFVATAGRSLLIQVDHQRLRFSIDVEFKPRPVAIVGPFEGIAAPFLVLHGNAILARWNSFAIAAGRSKRPIAAIVARSVSVLRWSPVGRHREKRHPHVLLFRHRQRGSALDDLARHVELAIAAAATRHSGETDKYASAKTPLAHDWLWLMRGCNSLPRGDGSRTNRPRR